MSNSGLPRRGFLGATLSAIGTALGASTLHAATAPVAPDESWLAGLNGKHKAFLDVAAIRDSILSRTNNFYEAYVGEYGLRDSDLNVIFGAHGPGVGFVLNDAMWSKYELGKMYSVTDPRTKAPAVRNIFVAMDPSYNWPSDYSMSALQKRGVKFLGCRNSMRNLSRQMGATGTFGTAAEVYAELEKNLVSGVTPVPAMMVAQNRAQEVGCRYVYVV